MRPPKGVILYGEPGTGKTLLAKAVANKTSATFLRLVGSELVQKYSGEGPKLVRDIFSTARDLAPSIVFIDEIDSIGTKRYDAESSGAREVQRTMLELLNQLDGFDDRGDVKVIMATNRIDTLDPALLRPGRIDRKIKLPLPNTEAKRRIFSIHTVCKSDYFYSNNYSFHILINLINLINLLILIFPLMIILFIRILNPIHPIPSHPIFISVSFLLLHLEQNEFGYRC